MKTFSFIALSATISATLTASALAVTTQAPQDTTTIRVNVTNLRNDSGQVCVLIQKQYISSLNSQSDNTIRQCQTVDSAQQATVVFENLPASTYAVAVFHDENSDGQFANPLLVMSREGYSFANIRDDNTIWTVNYSDIAQMFSGDVNLTLPMRY